MAKIVNIKKFKPINFTRKIGIEIVDINDDCQAFYKNIIIDHNKIYLN